MSLAVTTPSKLILVDSRILQSNHSWLTHLTNDTKYLVYNFLNDSREDLQNAISSFSATFDSIGICFSNIPEASTFQLLQSMESSPVNSICSVDDWLSTIQWFESIIQTIQCSSIEFIPFNMPTNGEDWTYITNLLSSSLSIAINISNSELNTFIDINITNPYAKLILVDDRVSDIENGILSSLTADTAYIVFNWQTDTLSMIKEKIQAFGINFSHVSIAQHGMFDSTYRLFSDMGEGILEDVEKNDPNLDSWADYRSFLDWLKTTCNTQFFDLLACYIWNNDNWRYIIQGLREDMYIRASVDITGSGGNFILESDNIDTIGIYFTREILKYKYSFPTPPLSTPTISGIVGSYRKYKFNYSQLAQTEYTIFDFSYELFKNGVSIRKQIFTPYEIGGISSIQSQLINVPTMGGLPYTIGKIQIVKTASYKRMYFLVTINGSSQNLSYYNWNSSTNSWDFSTIYTLTSLNANTSCFKFTSDGTRCVLATAPSSFLGAYMYYFDYNYSTGNITTTSPFSVIDNIKFTGCDIADDKSRIFASYNGNGVNNGFYYSSVLSGSYVTPIKNALSIGEMNDIICNSSGTTIVTTMSSPSNGYAIYDLSGSSWINRKYIAGTYDVPTSLCFVGTRADNMIISTDYSSQDSYSLFSYSLKYNDASYSTPVTLSNTKGTSFSTTCTKNITFDNDISGIFVTMDGDSNLYYTTLDYVTNYTTSPTLPNGTYTIANLDCGAYTMKLTVTAIAVTGGAYSSKTSTLTTSVTVVDAPSAPTFTQLSVGGFNNTIKMYYTKPVSDGSSAIIKYQYSLDNGTTFKTMTNATGANITTDGSYTISDASINAGGQYIMQLRAINTIGLSGEIAIDSNYANPVPYTYPDPPTLTFVKDDNTTGYTISPFTSNNGGSAILDYKYTVSDNSFSFFNTSASPVDSFFTPDTNKTYRYYSSNAAGLSQTYTELYVQSPPLPPSMRADSNSANSITITFTSRGTGVKYMYSLDNIIYNDLSYVSSGSFTINNVNPGNYTVYFKVYNGYVTSYPAQSLVTVYAAPESPSPISLNPTYQGLSFLFGESNSNNKAITNYKYSLDNSQYVDISNITTFGNVTVTGTNYTTQQLGLYKLFIFNTSGTFSVSNTKECNVLIVGAGGAGGTTNASNPVKIIGGGGGAGGVGVGMHTFNQGIPYNITVGLGGSTDGQNSSISGSDGTNIIATGGTAATSTTGGTSGTVTGLDGSMNAYGGFNGTSIFSNLYYNGIVSAFNIIGGGAGALSSSFPNYTSYNLTNFSKGYVGFPYYSKGGNGYLWPITQNTYGKGGNSNSYYSSYVLSNISAGSGNGGNAGQFVNFSSRAGEAGSSGCVIIAMYNPPQFTISAPINISTNVWLKSANIVGESAIVSYPNYVTPYNVKYPPFITNIFHDDNGILTITYQVGGTEDYPATTFLYSINSTASGDFIDLNTATPTPFTLTNVNEPVIIYMKSRNIYGDSDITSCTSSLGEPTFVFAIAGNTNALISFIPPTYVQNQITGYVYSIDYGRTFYPATITNNSFIINSLISETTYQVYLCAVNSNGYGSIGISNPFTPINDMSYSYVIKDTYIIFNITDSVATSFLITINGNTQTYSVTLNNLYSFGGLLSSKEYTATITSYNEVGLLNTQTVTFKTLPSPPVITNCTVNPIGSVPATVTVTFNASVASQYPIITYKYSLDDIVYTDISFNGGILQFDVKKNLNYILYLKANNGYNDSDISTIDFTAGNPPLGVTPALQNVSCRTANTIYFETTNYTSGITYQYSIVGKNSNNTSVTIGPTTITLNQISGTTYSATTPSVLSTITTNQNVTFRLRDSTNKITTSQLNVPLIVNIDPTASTVVSGTGVPKQLKITFTPPSVPPPNYKYRLTTTSPIYDICNNQITTSGNNKIYYITNDPSMVVGSTYNPIIYGASGPYTDLVTGVTYTTMGTGTISTGSAMVYDIPSAPIITDSSGKSSQIWIKYKNPTSNGASTITQYKYRFYPTSTYTNLTLKPTLNVDVSENITLSTSIFTSTDPNLVAFKDTSLQPLAIYIACDNSAGTSPDMSYTFSSTNRPYIAPNPPSSVTYTVTNNKINFTIITPQNNGKPITKYTYQLTPVSLSGDVIGSYTYNTPSSFQVDISSNSLYSSVKLWSYSASGGYSTTAYTMPSFYTLPNTPAVNITWSPNRGGNPYITISYTNVEVGSIGINSYKYKINSGAYITIPSNPYTINSGITLGNTYSINVAAVDNNNNYSIPYSQNITIYDTPDTPTLGTPTTDINILYFPFTIPSYTGGFPIQKYTYTIKKSTGGIITTNTYDSSKGIYFVNPQNEIQINQQIYSGYLWNVSSIKYFQIINTQTTKKCYLLAFSSLDNYGIPQMLTLSYSTINSPPSWDTTPLNITSSLSLFPTSASCFRLSHDEKYLIVGCNGGTSLYKYSSSNFATLTQITTPNLVHNKIDISDDGSTIVSITTTGAGYSKNGSQYALIDASNHIGLTLSSDGSKFACSDGTAVRIYVWNGTTFSLNQTILSQENIVDLRYTIDSSYLFTNKYTYSVFDSSSNQYSSFNNMTACKKINDTLANDNLYYGVAIDVDSSNNIYASKNGSNLTSWIIKSPTNTFLNPINYQCAADSSYTISSFKTYNGYAYSNDTSLNDVFYTPLPSGIAYDLSGTGTGIFTITFKSNSITQIDGYKYTLTTSGSSDQVIQTRISLFNIMLVGSTYVFSYNISNTIPGNYYKITSLQSYNTYTYGTPSVPMTNYVYVYSIPSAPQFNCISNTLSFDLSLNQLSTSNESIIKYQYSIDNGLTYKDASYNGNLILNTGRYNIIDPSLNYANIYKIQLRAVSYNQVNDIYVNGISGIDSSYITIYKKSELVTDLSSIMQYQKFNINFSEPSFYGSSLIKQYKYTIDSLNETIITASSDSYTDQTNIINVADYNDGITAWTSKTYENIQVIGNRVYILTHNSNVSATPKLLYYTNTNGVWNPNVNNIGISLEPNTSQFKFTRNSLKLTYTTSSYLNKTIIDNTNSNNDTYSRIGRNFYANGYLYIICFDKKLRRYVTDNTTGLINTSSYTTYNIGLGIDDCFFYTNNGTILYSNSNNIYSTNTDFNAPTLLLSNAIMYYSNIEDKLYYLKDNKVYLFSNNPVNSSLFSVSQSGIAPSTKKIFVFTLNGINFFGYQKPGGTSSDNSTYLYYRANNSDISNNDVNITYTGSSYFLKDIIVYDTYIIALFAYSPGSTGTFLSSIYKLSNFNITTQKFIEEKLFDYNMAEAFPSYAFISKHTTLNTYYLTYYGNNNWVQIQYAQSTNNVYLYDTTTNGTSSISINTQTQTEINFLNIDITNIYIASCYKQDGLYKILYFNYTITPINVNIITQPSYNKIYSAIALSPNSQYLSVSYANSDNVTLIDTYKFQNSTFTYQNTFYVGYNTPIYSMRYNDTSTMLFAGTTGTNMFFSWYVDTNGYLIGCTPYNTIDYYGNYSHPYPNSIDPNFDNYNASYIVSSVRYTSIDVSGNSIYLFPNCANVTSSITPYVFRVDLTPHDTSYSFISTGKTNLAKNNGQPYVVNIKAINYDNIESDVATINAYAYDVPMPPTFTVTPSYEKIQVNFTRPIDDGSKNIIGYKYKATPTSGTSITGTYTLPNGTDPTTGTFTITGCTAGTPYVVDISSISAGLDTNGANLISTSSPSSGSVIPYTLPNPPTDVSMIPVIGTNEMNIKYTYITNDTQDAGYTTILGYKYSLDGTTYIDAASNDFNIDSFQNISSFIPEGQYTVYIKSYNAAGLSPTANTSTTTNYGVPIKPDGYTIISTGILMYIDISFPPFSSVDTITSYKIGVSGEDWGDIVSVSNNNPVNYQLSANIPGTTTRRLFSTIENSNTIRYYNVKIIATNSRGNSIPFIDTNFVNVLTIPSVPQNTLYTPGLGEITLQYEKPSDTGGGTPVCYLYYLSNTYIDETSTPINDISYSQIPADKSIKTINNVTEFIDGSYTITSAQDSHVQIGYNVYVYMKVKIRDGANNPIYGQTLYPTSDASYITPYTYPQPPSAASFAPTTESVSFNISFVDTSANRGYTPLTNYSYTLSGGIYDGTPKNDFNIASSYTISNLSSSTIYTLKLYSKNAAGYSQTSNTYNFITKPIAPTITATTTNKEEINISFNTTDTNIQSYTYTLTGASTKTETIPVSTSFPYAITGLTTGTYDISGIANNGTWDSDSTLITGIQVFTNPSSPTIIDASAGYNKILIKFSESTNSGNRDISGYIYTVKDTNNVIITSGTIYDSGGNKVTSPNSSIYYTISEVSAGARILSLEAVNIENLTSEPVTSTTLQVYTVPDPPTFTEFPQAGYMNITFKFEAPSNTGNTPITNYLYAIQKESSSIQPYKVIPSASANTLITIPSSDLSYGYHYTIYLKSQNIADISPTDASATTAGVVYNIPKSPIQVSCSGELEKITFTYLSPLDDGSNNIIKYQYSLNNNSYIDMSKNNVLIDTDGSYTIYANQPNPILYNQTNTVKLVAVNTAGSGDILTMTTTPVPYTYPPAPTIGTITTSDHSANITLIYPTNNSGRDIISYGYYNSLGGRNTTNASSTSDVIMQITDLSSSYKYNYSFFSMNSENVYSSTNSDASFVTNPLPPIINSVTVPSKNSINISLTAPTYTYQNDSSFIPIQKYVYRLIGDSSTFTYEDSTLPSSIALNSIPAGNYSFEIQSNNGTKDSIVNSYPDNIRVFTTPSSPTINSATEGYNKVTITFTQDISTLGTGNSTIKEFQYTLWGNNLNNGSVSKTGIISYSTTSFNISGTDASTSFDITDVDAGTNYAFKIKTINIDNEVSIDAPLNGISVYTIPNAPTFVQDPSAGKMKITFSFNALTAPLNTGNSPIIQYEYAIQRETDASQSYQIIPIASAGSIITVPSNQLSYNSKYTIYLRAKNQAGYSSNVSSTTLDTVYSTPSVPTITDCSGHLNSITFKYTEPDNRGRIVTSYMYSLNHGQFVDIYGVPNPPGTYTITNPPANILYGQINDISWVAINEGGSGEVASALTTYNPYTYPPAPTPTLNTVTDTNVTINLSYNGDGGNEINYNLQYYYYNFIDSYGNESQLQPIGNAQITSTTIGGLTPSKHYYLKFYSKNSLGVLSNIPSSFDFITRPSEPTPTITTPIKNQISFQYSLPPSYEVPLTKYKYYITNDISGEVIATNSTIDIPILIPAGNYTFKMQVYNGTWYSNEYSSPTEIAVYGVPSAPTIQSFTASYESVDFTINPPSNNGNSTLSEYQYALTTGEVPLDSSYISIGLNLINNMPSTAGNSVYLYVRSKNQAGEVSTHTKSSETIIAYTLPTITSITLTRDTTTEFSPKISVTFIADNNSGYTPTTAYKYSVNGSSYTTLPDTTTRNFSINSSPDTFYDISMVAVNIAGQSSPIHETITQYKVPDPPSFNGSTIGGYNKITFSFNSSPVDPNTQIPVVKYQYSINGGSSYTDISNGNYILSGTYEILNNITAGNYYTVQLRAMNNVGYSSPVIDAVSVLVYTVPNAPASITVTASFESIDVTYVAPLLDGSNTIYKYQYVLQESTILSSPPDASYVDTNTTGYFHVPVVPTIGLSYNVYLRAVNQAGTGASIKSSNVTPYTYPQPPIITITNITYNTISYLLTEPTNTGYTNITGYYYKENLSDTNYININTGSNIISSLHDSTSYHYYVYSKNAAGYSQTYTDLIFNTLPSSPTITVTTNYPNQINVLCTYPSSDNQIPIQKFRFEVWTINIYSQVLINKIYDSSFSINEENTYLLTSIPQYATYTLRAYSYNGINESTFSQKKLINVFTYPSPPTLGTLTAGKENVTFTFTPLSTSGGRNVTKYKYSTDNFITTSYEIITSPVTFAATPGSPVNVWIKSVNELGFESTTANKFPDASAVIPYTNPNSPTITSITPTYVDGKNTFIINYTAGSNGYSPITNYYYSTDNGTTYTAMNVTTDGAYTIPVSFNLGTTYYFSIKSENIAGMSQPSNVLASESFNIPSLPYILSLFGGYEEILFKFSEPDSSGGTPIIKYQYSISGDTTISSREDITTTGGQYQMSGDYIIHSVIPGNNYYLYLYAVNIVGSSSPQISQYSVFAYTKPNTPSINTITTSTTTSIININAPNSFQEEGYSTITDYSYREDGTLQWTNVPYTSGDRNIIISSLLPSKTYTYNIAAKNIADYSISTNATFTTNPSSPLITNVTAGYENISFTFIASTTNGSNLLKHSVAIRDTATNQISNYVDMLSSQQYIINSGTFVIDNSIIPSLTVGHTYTLLLKCTNVDGKESEVTESTSTAKPYTLPATPDITVMQITATTLTFKISSLSDTSGGYTPILHYYYYHKGIQYTCTPDTNIIITDLSSSTIYSIGRSATNAAGDSNTQSINVTTNPAKPHFDLVSPKTESLEISYSLENQLNEGLADSSGLYYSYSTNGNTYTGEAYVPNSMTNNNGTFTISSLIAGTPYYIRLIKRLQNGQYSETATYYNSAIYPYTFANSPTITQIYALTTTSLHVDFTSPSTSSDKGYTDVNYYKYSINDIPITAQINTNDTSFNITGLSAGTSYSIKMLTNNTAGDSGYSSPTIGYTLPNYPDIISCDACGNKTIRVTYQAPTNGDISIDSYSYALDSSASGNFSTMGSSPFDITGLIAGHIYTLYFRSTNREGNSIIYTYPSTIEPYTLPNPPIFNSLTQYGINTLQITFTAATINSYQPVDYYYYLATSTQGDISGIITPTTYNIQGLTAGIDYTVTLYSVNGAGQTASANTRTLMPYKLPLSPNIKSITPGYEKIDVSINTPSREEEGYDIYGIQRYEYTFDGGNTYNTLNNNEIVGLIAGQTYNIKIRAVNNAGDSSWSILYQIIPYTKPNDPIFTIQSTSTTTITVIYTPHSNYSASAGFTTDISYEYFINNGGQYITAPSSPFIISGLTPSQQYTIRMRALNAADYSSGNENPKTPTTISTSPLITSATGQTNSIIITYKPSLLNGTSPITNYRFTLIQNSTQNATIYDIAGGAEGAVNINGDYTYTISGINATLYTLKLKTLNDSGSYSQETQYSSNISVYTYPSSPIINNITSSTNSITLYFSASSYDGNSSPLTYWYSLDTDTLNIDTTSKNIMANPSPVYDNNTGLYSYTLTNLTKYTPYYTTVYAKNAAGLYSALEHPKIVYLDGTGNTPTSDISTNTLPETTSPIFPNTTLTATPYRNSAKLAFSIPTNTGFTGYKYKIKNVTNNSLIIDSSFSSPIQPIVISDLSAGTPIYVELTAYNSFGNSITITSNTVTPYQPPDKIPSITVTPVSTIDTSYQVSFTHPTFDGGSPITNYYYKLNSSNTYTSLSPSSSNFTINTTDNNAVLITMYASNNAGDSPMTMQTLGERTVPNSPTVSLVPVTDGLQITITKPANDGNAPITGYKFSINNQTFDTNGNIYYDLHSTDSITFTLFNGNILTDINGNQRTINIVTSVLYTVYAIATNRLGDSTPGSASSYSFGTPNPPKIGNISYVENAVLIYFSEGDTNGSTTQGIKYSINNQPYTYIATNNLASISPIIIYTSTNVDFTINMITVSNNGDSEPAISNVVNIPDPNSSNVLQTISSGDKTDTLSTISSVTDILESTAKTISSDTNTNIIKLVNMIQDSTSTVSGEGSLRSVPLSDNINAPILYPNKATFLVRNFYKRRQNKK